MAVALAALAAPATAQAGGAMSFNGHVGQRTGAFPGTQGPLAGATVELQNAGGPVASTVTDSNGDYGFPNVQLGNYELVASKTGYVSQCRTISLVGNPVTAPLIELPTTGAAQAGDMNGHVTNSFNDAAIPDATVAIGYQSGCDPFSSDQTDTGGLYVFPTDSLPGPVHTVNVSAPGFHSETDTVTVYATTANVDYALDPLDTTDPTTRIKSVKVDHHSVTIRFKAKDPEPSDGGLNVTCEIDHLGGDECFSPQTYDGIHKGKHKLKLTAFDAAGNFDETPAKESFKVG